ncbi:MAG TPA: IPT/TIG domain-containing protein [Candidatus Acidoferrales bacterium]|nr:IPT/TIG domain-containing protein [Candidatus Acidoferrales bacterium]
MGRFQRLWAIPAFLAVVFAAKARAQTTYHLHEEKSGSYYLLKTTGPDAAATTLNWNLSNCSGCDTYPGTFLSQFTYGYDIVSGTTITFTLWVGISSSTGTYYPWAELEYQDSQGFLHAFCVATGSSAVTTAVSSFQISCSTTAAFSAGGYLFLNAGLDQATGPGRKKVSGELGVEGTLNGANDSQFTIPAPPAPSITSLSPTSGTANTAITMAGSHFGAAQGSSTVAFNGVSASVNSWADTSVTASVPGTTTTGNVVVTVAGQASNGISFTVVPSLTTLSPTSGGAGASVTINGYDLGSAQGSSTVTFNGTGATPTNWSATQIVAPVPASATSGPVVVTVGGQASNGLAFTVTVVTPSISSLSPASGSPGTSVTIAGSAFGATQGTSSVTFNGAPATTTSWSNTSIVASVPTNATTGNVVVTVSGAASNGVSFTVPPVISGISPASAGVGAFVSLSGTGFGPAAGSSTVNFPSSGGYAAEPSKWNATAIVLPVPGNATSGTVTVTIGGVTSNGVSFTLATAGTVSGSVTKASDGSAVNGAAVEIWQGGVVKGSTTSASNGSYSIAGVAPGTYNVEAFAAGYANASQTGVAVIAGQTATVNLSFGSGPAISSLSPSAGPVGAVVTISGSGFGSTQGGSAVSFDGAAGAPTAWSSSQIVVPVPQAATTGPVLVVVGGAASNTMNFTVGTGAIGGAVTQTSGGGAVSGASVQALQSNAVQQSATTDANGNYTLQPLNPGTFDLRVSATALGTVVQTGVSVAAGSTTTENISMPAAGTLSGAVTASGGSTPITGAAIAVSAGTDTVATGFTNTSGNYSIGALSAGSYTVAASAFGYAVATQAGVSITAGNTTTQNFSLTGQDVISYGYDDLGRLVSASDAQGNTAVYGYDAVGNLLSIAVNPSSSVSIAGFSPASGPAGTAVTITGTGFSADSAQDTASFNGTSATITSATATQLQATAPNGATTGTIRVTAPAGSATSSQSFNVTGSSGAPSITSFSPAIATPGSAFTITGTNFDPTPANDSTRLNITATSLSAASSTSLSAAVPLETTSGHLSVATALGNASTSGYLYVPPPPYSAASVEFAGPVQPGNAGYPFTINTATGIGLVVFDGAATGSHGAKVSAYMQSGNFGVCGLGFALLSPTGSTLYSSNCFTQGSFLDALSLPISGTYTFLLDTGAGGGQTGNGTLAFYSFTDLLAAVTPGGPGTYLPVSIGTPGQNARFTFSGSSGQRVSVVVGTGTGWSLCGMHVSLLNPDGTTLASNGCVDTGGNWISPQTLPQGGTYTVFIDPQGANTGTTSLEVNFVTDITGTITPSSSGGAATPAPNITIPGQAALYTFSATAGQQVSLYQQNVTLPGACPASLYILNPDGSQAYSNTCAGSGFFSGALTLNQTATYTLKLVPNGSGTGSATETMYLVPAPATGSFTLNQPGATVTTTVPGQSAQLTFSGSANQLMTLSANNNSMSCITVNVYPPGSQTSLYSTNNYDCYGSNFLFPQVTLPSTGTYTVIVTPGTVNTGSVTISGTSP